MRMKTCSCSTISRHTWTAREGGGRGPAAPGDEAERPAVGADDWPADDEPAPVEPAVVAPVAVGPAPGATVSPVAVAVPAGPAGAPPVAAWSEEAGAAAVSGPRRDFWPQAAARRRGSG